MLAVLASIAAVAGGQLAVSMTPTHPRLGQHVDIAMTGQVDNTGRLYVYRSATHRCGAAVHEERSLGRRVGSWAIDQPFERHVRFAAKRSGFVCVYLYSISCDAAGNNCGPATGLPPDAGFAQVRIRVRSARPSSHSVKSSAHRGRVIT